MANISNFKGFYTSVIEKSGWLDLVNQLKSKMYGVTLENYFLVNVSNEKTLVVYRVYRGFVQPSYVRINHCTDPYYPTSQQNEK